MLTHLLVPGVSRPTWTMLLTGGVEPCLLLQRYR